MRVLRVATCNLNQLAMDFEANLKNIKDSIAKAKDSGAVIRVGPELEIPGDDCEDHFLEPDTITHSWECLKEILTGEWTDGILCSIGMPVIRTLQLPSLMYEQYNSNDQTKAKACRLRQFHGVQMVQAMASKSTSR